MEGQYQQQSLLNQSSQADMSIDQFTEQEEITFQCVLVGDIFVGKSSFLIRFADGVFIKNHSSSVGIDFRFKTLLMDDYIVRLQTFDTAGQEHFRSLSHTYFKKADGVIVLYDITNYESFKNLEYWMDEIKNNCKQQNIPKVLVGHKSDLQDQRQVDKEEAQKFALNKQMDFFESSAKENTNVTHIFAKLAQKMLLQKLDLNMSQITLKSRNNNSQICSGNVNRLNEITEESPSIIKIQNNRRQMLINQQDNDNNEPKNVQCSCCNN